MDGLNEYRMLGGFLGLGVVLGAVPLVLPKLLSPRYHGPATEETYECGIDTIGSAWVRFGVSYYLFALVFVAFEVDLLYLFPVALVYGDFAWRDLVEVSMFLGILSLAIVYAWRKGVLSWR